MTDADPLAEVQIPEAARLRTKILYAALFLLFTTHFYDRLTVSYIDGLVRNNRIGLWTVLVPYLDTGGSVFLTLQLVVVLIYFLVGKNRIAVKPLRLQITQLTLRHAAYGALCGAAVVFAGLPQVLRLERHSGFVTLLTGEFYTIRSALIVALLLIVLPILGEIVFREIIFSNLQKQLSTPSPIIASSLLFAYSLAAVQLVDSFALRSGELHPLSRIKKYRTGSHRKYCGDLFVRSDSDGSDAISKIRASPRRS